MKLRGAGADDVKEVREIVQHLFTNIVKPARSKRDSRQATTHVDHLLFQLVDDMHLIWDADFFLDRAQELVKKAIDEHAEFNTAELDRSRPVKKGAATRRRLSEQVAVNTHTKIFICLHSRGVHCVGAPCTKIAYEHLRQRFYCYHSVKH